MPATLIRPASTAWRRVHPYRIALTTFRAGLATAMVLATFAQLANYEVYWRRIGLHDLGLRTGNFFSAFTFQVNLLGAVILVAGAWMLWRDHADEPLWFTRVRFCLLAAIVVVGVIYNLLLRNDPVGPGERVDWANDVVHVVAPLGVAIDWLVAPHSPRLSLSSVPLVLVYPIAWLLFTFTRGVLVPDELLRTSYYYPYGFLDPHGTGGLQPVLTMIAILVLLILAVGAIAVLIAKAEDRVTHARHRHALT
jgi:hypothetical protein